MSTQKTVLQEAGTVEESSLRLDVDKAEQIIDALNTDLAATYTLYHQIKKHHWNVEGDNRTSLENDLEMGGDVIESLRDHIEVAQNLGDHATAHMLREQLFELEEYVHHIEHYLEDDSLKQ